MAAIFKVVMYMRAPERVICYCQTVSCVLDLGKWLKVDRRRGRLVRGVSRGVSLGFCLGEQLCPFCVRNVVYVC